MKTILEVGNSFVHIKGDLDTNLRKLIFDCLSYSNEIEYELQSAFFLLKNLKRWGKSKKEIQKQQAKIENIKGSEHVHLLREDTSFPTGLLNIVKTCFEKSNCEFQEKDLRKKPKPYLILPWKNKPFDMRYYQKEAVEAFILSKSGIIEHATGTGKTITCANIIKKLRLNTLIIVPSSGLGLQIYNDFKVWLGKSKVSLTSTKMIREGKPLSPIRISTIQSISSLKKTGDLGHLLEGVDFCVFDEFHHSAAKSYTNLLEDLGGVYHKLGMTATFQRGDSKILSLWSVLSTPVHKYAASQAIADGFLTSMEIHVHKLSGKMHTKYQKEYDANYGEGTEILEGVSQVVRSINLKKEQVLILVKLKSKTGRSIRDYLEHVGLDSVFISGDDNATVINEEIERFNLGKTRILIGSSVIGEGINIQSAHHLINCVGGKSPIQTIQGAGRLVRLFPGKEIATYHDFRFEGTKFLVRHLKKRVGDLIRNFAPKDIIEIREEKT